MPHLPDSHHDHDPALVAAFAAGDTTGAEQERARELVASCTSCATLRDDLVAIAAAVHELPAPRRSRDFRLTAEQAASLRPSGWRRLLAPFAGPRFRLAAPLGTTMATLGVAGLMLSAMPGSAGFAQLPAAAPDGSDRYGGVGQLQGGAASPEATEGASPPSASSGPVVSIAPSNAPASQGPGASPQPAATDDLRQTTDPKVTVAPPIASPRPVVDSPGVGSPASGAWQPLTLASALLIVFGAFLVLGRVVARRTVVA